MKAESLIKKIQSEHNLLVKSLATLAATEWLQPGVVADWTVKDLVAHLTAWEKLLCGWYLAGLNAETAPIPAPGYSRKQIDHLNEQIFIDNRDRALEDIQAEFTVSYAKTLALVRSINEDDLFTPGRYAWTAKISLYNYVTANTCDHYRWARSKLRAWKR